MSTKSPSTGTLLTAEQERDIRLGQLARELLALDSTLVACLAKRLQIARAVLRAKRLVHPFPPIVRREIEHRRIAEMGELARRFGVDGYFAQSIEAAIIAESVKVQAELSGSGPESVPTREDLRRNLLLLTERVASTYGDPATGDSDTCPASGSFRRFESELIARLVSEAPGEKHLLVDAGCANGTELFAQIGSFAAGVGFDVSPSMIEEASARAKKRKRRGCRFEEADLEKGIPLDDGEACFVIMNNGTGSDFANLPAIMSEIGRVLRVGGRFYVSFYNAESTASAHGSLPWVSALRASPDQKRGTVTVRLESGESFEISGSPRSLAEVERSLPSRLSIDSSWTYLHTLSMLPPSVFFGNRTFFETVESRDRTLADVGTDGGAYLIVTGVKT